jgi:hypothetical protein
MARSFVIFGVISVEIFYNKKKLLSVIVENYKADMFNLFLFLYCYNHQIILSAQLFPQELAKDL